MVRSPATDVTHERSHDFGRDIGGKSLIPGPITPIALHKSSEQIRRPGNSLAPAVMSAVDCRHPEQHEEVCVMTKTVPTDLVASRPRD